ncbi:MAG: efflux transporter outer membrane subunit [Chlamydiales bacterium]
MRLLQSLILVMMCGGGITSCRPSPHCTIAPLCPSENWFQEEEMNMTPPPDMWWTVFEDSFLDQLMHEAFCDNYSLKAAYERVVQAFYLRKEVLSQYFPTINANVNYTESLSQFAFGSAFFGNNIAQNLDINFANGVKQKVFIAGFDARWEIDLFGNTYYQVCAAAAQQQSFQEVYHGVQLSLAAELAREYFTFRWQQSKEQLLNQLVEAFEEKEQLIAMLRQRGIESDFLLLDTENRKEEAQEQLEQLKGEKAATLFRIGAILGRLPDCFLDMFSVPFSLPQLPQQPSVGIPSEILRRRPDIRQAEWMVAGAAAEIGVALTDFFPKLSLLGNGSFERTEFASLFASGPAWLYNINVLTPIFEGGRLRAQYQGKRAQWREFVNQYYETVVRAIAESEGAIARYQQSLKSLGASELAYQTQETQYQKTSILHRSGIADVITLADAQIRALESQIQREDRAIEATVNLVSLYKSLGGGWGEYSHENRTCH